MVGNILEGSAGCVGMLPRIGDAGSPGVGATMCA
jgi:hypothetical protein